jgi:ADP-ribose pyrophosphatase YjhB (NUDIX family)
MIQNRFTSTGFVINDSNEILMIKHKKLGKWMPPGGHVDENELPCDAVLREVYEETGVRAQIIFTKKKKATSSDVQLRELPLPMEILLTNFEGDGLYNCINLNYLCYADDTALNPSTAEVSDIGWFSLSEALKLDTYDFIRASIQTAYKAYQNEDV